MQKLNDLNPADLTDAQKNLRANALLYLQRLQGLSAKDLEDLAQFLINRCYLIAVSTPDLESAYRIFSILNDRGMDLSHTDILKAEIVGAIADENREKYTKKWEDLEDDLGREHFQDLIR